MATAGALLVPSPHARLDVAIPLPIELGDDGEPPADLGYDGNHYVLSEGRGPSGEWVYQLLEE
jgi:hypothetical protein